MKKALILALLAAVLVSSGCLGGILGRGESIITGNGVIITAFEPDFPELEPGDTFDLYIEVENVGGADATNTYAHLFNIDTDEWQVTEVSKSIGKLEAPDEVAEIPGDIGDAIWDMEAPDVPQGVVFKYMPKVRLMYEYQTIASATIQLMGKEEYKRLKERDMLNVPPIITDVSKGPIAVEINARTPIVVDDYDEDTVEFRVKVDLLERGGVVDPSHDTSNIDLTSDDMDKLNIRIDAAGVEDTAIDCDAFKTDILKNLRRGESLIYTCELKASTFSATAAVPVTVTLTYDYYEDVSTDLKVTAS